MERHDGLPAQRWAGARQARQKSWVLHGAPTQHLAQACDRRRDHGLWKIDDRPANCRSTGDIRDPGNRNDRRCHSTPHPLRLGSAMERHAAREPRQLRRRQVARLCEWRTGVRRCLGRRRSTLSWKPDLAASARGRHGPDIRISQGGGSSHQAVEPLAGLFSPGRYRQVRFAALRRSAARNGCNFSSTGSSEHHTPSGVP